MRRSEKRKSEKKEDECAQKGRKVAMRNEKLHGGVKHISKSKV